MSAQDHHGDYGGNPAIELPALHRRSWLAVIMAAALGLRSYCLAWGLPAFIFEDTRVHFAVTALRAAVIGDWMPRFLVHPPLYPSLLSLATVIATTVTGRELHLTGPQAQADLAWIVAIGRVITVVLATLTVAAVYAVCRRLIGTRSALWAAAFFAVAPMHVIESHRINVDTPMLLLALLSAHQAVVAYQSRNRAALLRSFALAAAAGATKYTGLFAGTLPLWVAMSWAESSWRQRLRLVATGGVVSLLSFAVCSGPALFRWDRLVATAHDVVYIAAFQGAPGVDLTGEHWVYAPYLYLIFVGLPFVLGWAVFLASLLGAATMALRQRQALVLIAAATLPFLLLQGAAETATARYYLPLAPYLAMMAGAFVTGAGRRKPVLGRAIGGLILGYTAILACSQVQRIGGAPQAATAATLERIAETKRGSGPQRLSPRRRKLVVGYPSRQLLLYDALRPHLLARSSKHRVVYFPTKLRFPGDAVPPEEALRQDRLWIGSKDVDAVVVTSRWENLRTRQSFRGREEQFYQNLTSGRLGFRLTAHERTSYFTQSWYEWADPSLDTIWTAGIGGYKLYVRDDPTAAANAP